MGYTYQFMDNTSYSAADVNKAFSRLTTQGVSLFADTGNPLMDINTAVANMSSLGVADFNSDACKVTVTGGVYKISKGTAFMADGSSITFDDSGEVITVTPSTLQYVFLQSNPAENKIDIVVSTTAGGANTVPLATINGTVTDTRKFATAKVATATANISVEKTVSMTFSSAIYNYYNIDVGWGGFKYILFLDSGWRTLTEGVETDVIYVGTNDQAWVTKSGDTVTVRTRLAAGGAGTHDKTMIFV